MSLILQTYEMEGPDTHAISLNFFKQVDRLYFIKYDMPLEYLSLMNSMQLFDIQDMLIEKTNDDTSNIVAADEIWWKAI